MSNCPSSRAQNLLLQTKPTDTKAKLFAALTEAVSLTRQARELANRYASQDQQSYLAVIKLNTQVAHLQMQLRDQMYRQAANTQETMGEILKRTVKRRRKPAGKNTRRVLAWATRKRK